MPRRYYRRRTYRSAPKKKWAPHILTDQLGISQNAGFGYRVVCSNSTEASTPVPVIVKVGNVKIQGDAYVQNVTISTSVVLYVMFLPQGVGVYQDLAKEHPEWIMGWKQLDLATTNQSSSEANAFSLTSRLKRNLQSGDRLIVFTVSAATVAINYTCQYFTCAN